MKIKDLRAQIQNYSNKDLQLLITEMYKAVPKKVKEDKELDQLIADPEYLKKKRKMAIHQVELPDMGLLSYNIETFIDDAERDYYFAPNSVIPKKERSKWRFTAKQFYKDLIAAYQVPENRKEATVCIENLYKLFCKATGYYMFVSPEPFEALNIPQKTFLEQTLRMKKEVEEPQIWVKNSLSLALDNEDDKHYYKEGLSEVFVNLLPTPPMTEIAIEEAIKMKLRKDEQELKPKKGGFISGTYQFEDEINNIVETIFLLFAKLHEWGDAISYWKENYLESSKKIRLYRLLNLLSKYNRIEEWKQEYECAIQSGAEPRGILQKTYSNLQANGKFPDFVDIY